MNLSYYLACAPPPVKPNPKRGLKCKGTNNLTPIQFHPIHGEHIQLSSDGSSAVRVESFCKGIAFSNRSIKINEKVYLKISQVSSNWSGSLRFGFTTKNPSSYSNGHRLPKYACPDMTNMPGNWAKALPEKYATLDTIICYYVKPDGTIHYTVNGEDKGLFFTGVETSSPLYALIDIYGNTTAIQFLNPKSNTEKSNTEKSNTEKFNTTEKCNIKNEQMVHQSFHHGSYAPVRVTPQPVEQSRIYEQSRGIYDQSRIHEQSRIQDENYGYVQMTPARHEHDLIPSYLKEELEVVPFHRLRGMKIRLSNDHCVAERDDCQYSQGYVFMSRSLRRNERLMIQITGSKTAVTGSLAFGLTTCDPSTLSSRDLPSDPHLLLDRPEYWVVVKNVASNPASGDLLTFYITSSGQVQLVKNQLPPVTLMHVDPSQRFFPFFDLHGSTVQIKSLGASVPVALQPPRMPLPQVPVSQVSVAQVSVSQVPVSQVSVARTVRPTPPTYESIKKSILRHQQQLVQSVRPRIETPQDMISQDTIYCSVNRPVLRDSSSSSYSSFYSPLTVRVQPRLQPEVYTRAEPLYDVPIRHLQQQPIYQRVSLRHHSPCYSTYSKTSSAVSGCNSGKFFK